MFRWTIPSVQPNMRWVEQLSVSPSDRHGCHLLGKAGMVDLRSTVIGFATRPEVLPFALGALLVGGTLAAAPSLLTWMTAGLAAGFSLSGST